MVRILGTEYGSVEFAQVHAEKHASLTKEMEVQGWPMLIWSHRGHWLRYEGKMQKSQVLAFVKARLDAAPVQLDEQGGTLSSFLADRVGVVFVASTESLEHRQLFEDVALWGRQMDIPP